MQARNGSILEELEKFRSDDKRLERFNEVYTGILKNHYNDVEYLGKLFRDEDEISKKGELLKAGTIRKSVFTGQMDKTSVGTNYYSEAEGRFIGLPPKEYLLLSIIAFGMKKHTDQIMEAAGYISYIKNLNEFIISVGLKDNKSLDEIRDKLIDYGFRGNHAIDTEIHYDQLDTDSGIAFNEIITKYFKPGQNGKKIVEESGLYSIRFDSNKNMYYYYAFTGKRNSSFRLTNEQCLRFFTTMKLNKKDKLALAKELICNHFIYEEEEKFLIDLIEEGNNGYMKAPTWDEPAQLDVNGVSLLTRMVEDQLPNVLWVNIDNYIKKNFGNIRSFAMFFNDVFEYNNMKVADLEKRFGIPDSDLYEYKNGLSLPNIARLSVIVTLFPKMTKYIYLQLSKKSGTLEFGENSEQPLTMIVNNLLDTTDDVTFGLLFVTLEEIINYAPDIKELYQDIMKAYKFQVDIIATYILDKKNGVEIDDSLKSILKYYKKRRKDLTKMLTLSESIETADVRITQEQFDTLKQILVENYSMNVDSRILRAFKTKFEKSLEE